MAPHQVLGFLNFHIFFPYVPPCIFTFSLKHAAVATVLHASYSNFLTECEVCTVVLHIQCSVLCVLQTLKLDLVYTLYDFSCDKSGLMGLFCSFLKFKVVKVKEEINNIEASCSLHCS